VWGDVGEGAIMRDQLLGTTQSVLSVSLDPGESVVTVAGQFAWMTDSIEMAGVDEARRDPRLCVYTATGEPGVVAFASWAPGRILGIDVGPQDAGYLVRESGFLARTPGVQVDLGSQWDAGATRDGPGAPGLAFWRISGSGRAWVELSGDVVRHELTAGQSLRVHPGHVGMADATVAVQVAEVYGVSGRDAYPCAVLSGPGAVWLQSMPEGRGRPGRR
jgi:uncharacterized protein (AIM24 family)